MRRYLAIGLVWLATSLPWQLSAAIDLTSSPRTIQAKPGDLITLSFTLANTESLRLALVDSITTQESWKVIPPEPREFEIQPLGRVIRLAALKVPKTCPVGKYQIAYKVSAVGKPGEAISDTIEIAVSGIAKLVLKLENAPRIAIAGDRFEVAALLENYGNTGLAVDLSAACEKACEVSNSIKNVFLEAGQRKSVPIECITSKNVTQKVTAIVRVDAKASTNDGDSISVAKTVRIDVIPQIAMAVDPYVKLPSLVRLTTVADKRRTGYQFELLGAGTPWEGKFLSVDFKSPDIEDIGRYSSRDLFSLRYSQKATQIHIGDQGYSISPLLERYNYGRGFEIKHQLDGFLLHSFYVQRRWESPTTKEAGFSLGRPISRSLSLRANAIWKNKAGDSTQTWLYSLEGDLVLPLKTTISCEIAAHPHNNSLSSEKLGQRIEVKGSLPHSVTYSGEWIRAAPKFNGYYRDAQYGLLTLAVPISRHISSRFRLRTYDSNLDGNLSKQYGARERDLQGGTIYQIKPSTRLSVELQRFSRSTPIPKDSVDFAEGILKISGGYTGSPIGFNASAEFGNHTDRYAQKTHAIQRYTLNLQIAPNPSSTFGLSLKTGDSYYSAEKNKSRDFGLSASLRMGKNLNASLKYLLSQRITPAARSIHNFWATFNIRLAQRHEIVVRGLISNLGETKSVEPSLLIQYSLKTPIPIARNKKIGSIEGRVLRSDTSPPEPISRALVQLGSTYAVTDRKGIFRFNGIQPGLHNLYLDPSSLGNEITSAQPMPIEVKVTGGKTTKTEVCLVKRAKVQVWLRTDSLRVELRPLARSELPISLTGQEHLDLNGIEVLIESREEAYREIIKNQTSGISKSLRPGIWRIKPIPPKGFGKVYKIEPDQITIELKPGCTEQITFMVKEKRRPLLIIDSGEIRVSTLNPLSK